MVEEITPSRNPFFAGPQKKQPQQPVQPSAQPVQPVQPQQPVPQQQPKPVQPKPVQPQGEGFFHKNKKLLLIVGVVAIVAVALFLALKFGGVFGGEYVSKV